MAELIKVKLRKVGSSFGVLLPQERIREAHLEVGDEVEVAFLPHQRDFSGFGLARNFPLPFVRDKKVRQFS